MRTIRWIVVLSLAAALLVVVMFGLEPPSVKQLHDIFDHGPTLRPPKWL